MDLQFGPREGAWLARRTAGHTLGSGLRWGQGSRHGAALCQNHEAVQRRQTPGDVSNRFND